MMNAELKIKIKTHRHRGHIESNRNAEWRRRVRDERDTGYWIVKSNKRAGENATLMKN
jgi:hypothetical protein